jgi:hypothetical protein
MLCHFPAPVLPVAHYIRYPDSNKAACVVVESPEISRPPSQMPASRSLRLCSRS